MALLELENAHVAYDGITVLDGVSLRIARGEKIAFVGPSGAGKSTLLNLLYERCKADAALVPQELGLVRVLSVFHNIYMGRLNRHGAWYNVANLIRPLKREISLIRPIVENLGLEDKLFARVETLSGGQQQRTAIGRAVHRNSPIFIGDEPVSAVDGHQSRMVLDTIVASHDTVILSMHDVGLALACTDRVVGIRNGRIVLDESTAGMNSGDLDALYRTDA